MTLEASGSQADVLRLCKLAGLPRGPITGTLPGAEKRRMSASCGI